jgi:hypothetical protein
VLQGSGLGNQGSASSLATCFPDPSVSLLGGLSCESGQSIRQGCIVAVLIVQGESHPSCLVTVESPRGVPEGQRAKRWLRMRLASQTTRPLAGGSVVRRQAERPWPMILGTWFGSPSDRPASQKEAPDAPCFTDQPGSRCSLLQPHEKEFFSNLLELASSRGMGYRKNLSRPRYLPVSYPFVHQRITHGLSTQGVHPR